MSYYKINFFDDTFELQHYGVKGMKWGIKKAVEQYGERRAARKAAKKKLAQQRAKTRGPRRFRIMNASNSAARSFYRKERTGNFKTYRKQERRQSVKEARLTQDQINAGRYRVARFRNIAIKSLSAATGVGAALVLANPAGILAAPVVNAISGGMYYSRQQRAYGGTRDKYQSQDRVRNQNK